MNGMELIQYVAQNTGLPKDLIIKELQNLANEQGVSPDHLSLTQLRFLIANYMQDVLTEVKRRSAGHR